MAALVTVFGGSGFVGRYIVRRLAKAGYRVRVAVRRPNEALFLRTYGTVGQVEPVLCNIRDDASVAMALRGAVAVVNCVGTFDKGGANNFEAVQVEGAKRVARLATAAGVSRLVHISAIGADAEGESLYAQTKANGETAIIEAFPSAVILRPSVIFGPEDGFFNRFAGMARLGPVFPLVGGNTAFQPVYVDDVAAAAVAGVQDHAVSGVYELGGPEAASLKALIERMLVEIHRRRLVVNLPMWIGGIMAFMLDAASALTIGVFKNGILTRDQAKQLASDNVVTGHYPGLSDLGISPTHMLAILPNYLWRFRPSGQYDAIKDSAKALTDRLNG
ncbi:MAG: complex I NDUFA9 subunit family protein [Deltaproteobacteria bacterium]